MENRYKSPRKISDRDFKILENIAKEDGFRKYDSKDTISFTERIKQGPPIGGYRIR